MIFSLLATSRWLDEEINCLTVGVYLIYFKEWHISTNYEIPVTQNYFQDELLKCKSCQLGAAELSFAISVSFICVFQHHLCSTFWLNHILVCRLSMLSIWPQVLQPNLVSNVLLLQCRFWSCFCLLVVCHTDLRVKWVYELTNIYAYIYSLCSIRLLQFKLLHFDAVNHNMQLFL